MTWNDVDIRTLNRREYYEKFSAIFQELTTIPGSLAVNVAASETDIDMDKVKRCVAQADLTAKFESLPNGYETTLNREVYEDAVELSGGERQRAFLALALAQTPAVLLLDEPFSALDPAAVRELTGVLLALKAEKKMSIVMVVHDLNLALHSADILLGLQAGKVAFCAPPKVCADALPELFFLPQELLQSGSDGRKYLFPC